MPSDTLTRRWLRMAEEFASRAVEFEELLREAREQIPQIEETIARLREQEKGFREKAESRLSLTEPSSSMFGSKMELQNAGAKDRHVKTAATMTKRETRARKALLNANLTPQDVASELKVGRSTVNAWLTGTRSIPKHHARTLKEKRRIPLDAWEKLGE